jgi:hypothetical protein
MNGFHNRHHAVDVCAMEIPSCEFFELKSLETEREIYLRDEPLVASEL